MTGYGRVGCHCVPPTTTPIGRLRSVPPSPLNTTSTTMVERRPLLRFAKKRIVGCPMPTHMAPVVALEPAGSDSDEPCLLPPTFQGSFPLTIFAPPLRVHPELDSAKPPGAGT